jgi:hypothetical protein
MAGCTTIASSRQSDKSPCYNDLRPKCRRIRAVALAQLECLLRGRSAKLGTADRCQDRDGMRNRREKAHL